MMRAVILLTLLVPSCFAGSRSPGRKGHNDLAIVRQDLPMMEAMEGATPDSQAEGSLVDAFFEQLGIFYSYFFIFVCVCAVMAKALGEIENRRKVAAEAWLAEERTYNLYRGLACISVCQFGFAVSCIWHGTAYLSGFLDLANASIGYYLTARPLSFAHSALPAYLILTSFTSIVDVLMLLWDLEQWGGNWSDVVRPCLSFANVYVAYTFLHEIRKHSGKGSGKGDGLADRLLDTVLASSLVQQAAELIGMVEVGPLPSSQDIINSVPLISSDETSDTEQFEDPSPFELNQLIAQASTFQDSHLQEDSQYKVGQKVQCRHAGLQWKDGVVESLSPLKVKREGWDEATEWDEVRALPTEEESQLTDMAADTQTWCSTQGSKADDDRMRDLMGDEAEEQADVSDMFLAPAVFYDGDADEVPEFASDDVDNGLL